jgi:hypothetical protein
MIVRPAPAMRFVSVFCVSFTLALAPWFGLAWWMFGGWT